MKRASACTTRTRTRQPPGFELRLALFGHGWVDLAPHEWCERTRTLHTALRVGDTAVDLTVRSGARDLALRVDAPRTLPPTRVTEVRDTMRRMLRLDEDLAPFWQQCRARPELAWVARRGAGRIMRAATTFEDLMKLLFTTNCSWSATRLMTSRLIEALGEAAPSGRRAFPSPTACAEQGSGFYREVVRAGYRADSCVALARKFAVGDLDDATLDDPERSTDALRELLLALPGFGPYAAGQALRLLGRHDDLALDSWCRGKLATMRGRKKPPADATVERHYRSFGSYKGLALWMDLTADWHGERDGGDGVLQAGS